MSGFEAAAIILAFGLALAAVLRIERIAYRGIVDGVRWNKEQGQLEMHYHGAADDDWLVIDKSVSC